MIGRQSPFCVQDARERFPSQTLIGSKMKYRESQMKRKKIRGQANIRASISQPSRKKLRMVRRSAPMRGPRLRRLTKSKLAKNSALPNTAGITVVKLKVVQKTYSSGEKISAPMYVQFWVRRLSSSKIHQIGAETRKSPTY